MNLQKYFNEHGGPSTPHRGYLYWNNPGQLPIRYQANEVARLQNLGPTTEVFEYYCAAFDILDPQDRASYQVVVDRILSGWYHCKNRTQLTGEHSTKIWLEWVQRYRVPAGGRDG